jgi:hypothetical protein
MFSLGGSDVTCFYTVVTLLLLWLLLPVMLLLWLLLPVLLLLWLLVARR